MKSQTNKFPCLLLLIAGTAVFLSSAGIARILNRNPIASGRTGEILSPDKLPAIKVRCSECCVIS